MAFPPGSFFTLVATLPGLPHLIAYRCDRSCAGTGQFRLRSRKNLSLADH
jgi:hypothetical protein